VSSLQEDFYEVEMGTFFTGYDVYIRYKKVIEILEKKDLRSDEVRSLTDISKSTLEKILVDLLEKGIIKVVRFDMKHGKARVFAKVKEVYMI